jgi:4'-phosphopantetheinyl transferase
MSTIMLDEHTVLAVLIRLDEPPVDGLLDDDERQRAARFVFERDRRRFIASHSATRVVLGRQIGIAPASVRYAVAERGKPRVVDAPVDVRFNLSHSGERALLAVAIGREVGVDIEATRELSDLVSLAERVFSPSERERLLRSSNDQREEIFFRLWTRKESFIKALGDGMYFPLAEFEVSSEPAGEQLLLSCAARPNAMGQWTTRAWPCEPGYVAAITVEGSRFEIESIAYEPNTTGLRSKQ